MDERTKAELAEDAAELEDLLGPKWERIPPKEAALWAEAVKSIIDDDPEEEHFMHEGFRCGILRHPTFRHLCGYVIVPEGHPWYGKERSEVPAIAHGTITWAKAWAPWEPEEEEKPPRSVGAPEGPRTWCVGFDTNHFGDFCPGEFLTFVRLAGEGPHADRVLQLGMKDLARVLEGESHWWTMEEVRGATRELARQAREAVENPEGHRKWLVRHGRSDALASALRRFEEKERAKDGGGHDE